VLERGGMDIGWEFIIINLLLVISICFWKRGKTKTSCEHAVWYLFDS
jgi:hypothetical protein